MANATGAYKMKSSEKFPRIYRIITEKPVYKKALTLIGGILVFFVAITLVVGIAFFTLKIYKNYVIFQNLSVKRQNLQNQISFWQSVVDKYDGYKDAYFRIGLLEYQLGDFQKARNYNEKALLLDPNFEDAKNLEVILNKK